MTTETLLKALLETCEKAGALILDLRSQQSLKVTYKSDQSPVTIADQKADQMIRDCIQRWSPKAHIVSEESAISDYAKRKDFDEIWLVDPLDGTKEYINGSNDFTINIARLRNGRLDLSVLTAPAHQEAYFAVRGQGAFRILSDQSLRALTVRTMDHDDPTVLVSRSHKSVEFDVIKQIYPKAKSIPMGSSLKFCRIAEGQADIYLRLFPTSEWDTAAGQLLVEEAGGMVLTHLNEPITYNRADVTNPPFVAFGDPLVDWTAINALIEQRYGHANPVRSKP